MNPQDEYILENMTSDLSPAVGLMSNVLTLTSNHLETMEHSQTIIDESFQLCNEVAASLIR